MATYFKYAERSADSQVNWAEIGKNMTDMLKEQNRIREEKKSAIDAASREFGETLANAPQGEDVSMNTWALEYGDNASQYMLMQDRLLKSGQMKLKDYTVGRQNLLDGTTQAFNLSKEYQSKFSEKMERYKKGESQDLEQWLMAQAETFADFTKSQLYINPTDGKVSVAMKEKKNVNGKDVYVMNTNPDKFATVNSLRNQIAGTYDRFDTNAVTTAFVDGLGEEVRNTILKESSLRSGGMILKVEDIRSRTDIDENTKAVLYKFADSENQFINASLANPYNRLSVLTNSKKFAPNGEQYTFTYDEAEAKKNPAKILLRQDPRSKQPTPEFSEEQMKVSQDFMRTELRAKYNKKSDIQTTPQSQLQERRAPTPTEVDINEKQKAAKNLAQNLVYNLTGNSSQADSSTKYLTAQTGLDFQRNKTGVTIVNNQTGETQTFKFRSDGKTLANPREFVKSYVGTVSSKLGVSEDDVLKYFGQLLPKGAIINEGTQARGFDVKAKPEDPLTTFGNHISKTIVANDIKGMEKRDAAEVLTRKLAGLGSKVKASILYNDDIYVVNDDGTESPKFDIKKPGTIEALKKWIKANPNGKTAKDKNNFVKGLIKTKIIQSGTGELD